MYDENKIQYFEQIHIALFLKFIINLASASSLTIPCNLATHGKKLITTNLNYSTTFYQNQFN